MTVGNEFGTREEESDFVREERSSKEVDEVLAIDGLSIRGSLGSNGAKHTIETSVTPSLSICPRLSPYLHPIEGESTAWTPVPFELTEYQSRFKNPNERLSYGANVKMETNEQMKDASTLNGGEMREKVGVLLPFVEGEFWDSHLLRSLLIACTSSLINIYSASSSSISPLFLDGSPRRSST